MPLKLAVKRMNEEKMAYDEWERHREEYNWRHRASWEFQFVLWPRRCYLTNKWIWLKRAYCGTFSLYGPGDPVIDHRWHDKYAHLIWLLES